MVRSIGLFLLFVTSKTLGQSEANVEVNLFSGNSNNWSATDSVVTFHAPSEAQHDDSQIIADVLTNRTGKDTNISHFKTSTASVDWNDWSPKLKFPNVSSDKQYRMAELHLERGIFVFDFLRKFLSLIQPYDVPVGLVTDAIENRISASTLISESLQLEAILLSVVGTCCILCCITPGVEIWLACRPLREDYQPSQHPSALTFFLAVCVCILGVGTIAMNVCNEIVSKTVEKFPMVIEAAMEDLNDYHSSTAIQLRKCLSRSLDVASEAILADIDNVEDLLGRPVQTELSSETGLDIALNTLAEIVNASRRVSSTVESLLTDGENIHMFGKQMNREIDDLRRNLDSLLRTCTGQDRPLCNIIDPSVLRLTLKMEQLVRDERLLYFRDIKQENLTETIRQARGKYLYIPQRIATNSLEVRNQIRREINKMRARIVDETRNIEARNFELIKQLEFARHLTDHAMPHIIIFEHIRWLTGIGTIMCILLGWFLLFGGLCCRCYCEEKVRPTLLCGVFLACLASTVLWFVSVLTLILSSHTELIICRPLDDPNYSTIQAILETRTLLGRKLSVPLRDLFEKCRENEAAYPAVGLINTMKLDQLTAYWTWSSFSRVTLRLKVELKTLKIFTPYLKRQLQNLLYASELNLTEHRIMIQGRIFKKDLKTFSDEVDNVAQEMNDRVIARSLETVVANMQDLISRLLKPLIKLQDTLLYKLATLELQLQPFQGQVNQSLSHLTTIQYYINHQGDKIGEMKTKLYVNRLANYLDQWRSHVMSEMGKGLTKCRPLWDIIEGIKFLLCNHFLGNLSGYGFSTFLCAVIMIASTPIAHILSLAFKSLPTTVKDDNCLPARPDEPRAALSEEGSWNSPE